MGSDGKPSKELTILHDWCCMQRARHAAGTLSVPRVEALKQRGFLFDEYDAAWDDSFRRLDDWQKSHGGSTSVPRSVPGLGNWVHRSAHCTHSLRSLRCVRNARIYICVLAMSFSSHFFHRQRYLKHDCKLAPEREAKLNAINFEWHSANKAA